MLTVMVLCNSEVVRVRAAVGRRAQARFHPYAVPAFVHACGAPAEAPPSPAALCYMTNFVIFYDISGL